MIPLFRRRDIEQYTDSLAAYMPGGRLFSKKSVSDSKFRELLRGLAWELFRANGYLREYSAEILPDETEKFVSEWESTVGIPDGCFKGDGTLEERRRDVLIKLAESGVQTEQDFIDLAALFGVTVKIVSGYDAMTFPLTFPILFFDTEYEGRFTIVVKFTVPDASRFPLTFPFIFGSNEISVLECVFRRLKPANCNIIFIQE